MTNAEEVSAAAAALGRRRTPKKAESSRRTLAKAREALEADPALRERRRAAVSAAQKARWERYRQEKEAAKKTPKKSRFTP